MEIKINDITYHIPSSWNDLLPKKRILCYQIIMGQINDLFAPQELLPFKRIELLKALLDIDQAFMESWEQDCLNAYEEDGRLIFLAEVDEILEATNFLFEKVPDQENQYQIKLGLTKCPWPKLEHRHKNKKKRLYGPADGLSNLNIYELGRTFTLFEQYLNEQDESKIDELLAVLYRPAKSKTKKNKRSGFQGDRRLPLLHHESTIPKRQVLMASLHPTIKAMILFWFASCRQAIIESEQFQHLFSDEPQTDDPGFGWGGLLLGLAGGLINLEDVAKQPYANAFTYLSYLEHQQEQAEQKRKRKQT